MISLANKINVDAMQAVANAAQSAFEAMSCVKDANEALEKSKVVLEESQKSVEKVDGAIADLIARREAGEFNGKQGDAGVITTIEGQFGFQKRDGHLFLLCHDGTQPPNFYIDENGHLKNRFGG